MKKRKRITVDEKEITISFGRRGLEAKAFLKKVRGTCKGRLPRIFVDGGAWYPWALGRAGFQRCTVLSFGPSVLSSVN
jgi:transposase-like protein